MKRYFYLFCGIFFALLRLPADPVPRPNMIFILMDDFGYNDLGVQSYPDPTNCYPDAGPSPKLDIATIDPDIPSPNQARLLTPVLDQMAASGLRLTSFHSSSSCSPSRASLMTGRYDRRVSINSVFFPDNSTGLNTQEVTLPELLRECGYNTAMVGKWHLGYCVTAANPMQYLPCRHGFQEFFGVPHSNDMSDFALIENERIIDPDFRSSGKQTQLIWRYTEWALEYIQRKTASRTPFFLYLANSMPHIPTYPSDREFLNADGTEWPKFQGSSGVNWYYDVIKEVDHSVGRILAKLADLDIENNTIVIFTSDNGPWVRFSNINCEQNSVGCAYPLRNSKGTTWEGGCRVPFLVRWPGHIPSNRVSDEITGLVDILPTLVGLAGGSAPDDRVIDGIDLWPLWFDEPGWVSPRSSYALFSGSGLDAVMKGDWKLRYGRLYNLIDDIQEQVDLAATHPVVLADLLAEKTAVENSIAADRQARGVFTPFEVTLSSDEIHVDEGGTGEIGVALSHDPGMEVTVNVAWFSGDRDLSVLSGDTLLFDSNNWSVTQDVIFAATVDPDSECGGAVFRLGSSQIDAVRELFVFEMDADVLPELNAHLIWPAATEFTLDEVDLKITAQAATTMGVQSNLADAVCRWLCVSGADEVRFTADKAKETGIEFLSAGTYHLRFRAEHPAAADYGVTEFSVHVAPVVTPASLLRFSPLLAYDAALFSGDEHLWCNIMPAAGYDWLLAADVALSVSDPASDSDVIDAAFSFDGGYLPTGGVALHLDAYSTANASIELWFRPAAFPVATHQVIWESGGDIGTSFTISSNTLFFAVDDGSANAPEGDVAQAVLKPSTNHNGFIHCVGVIDLSADQIKLYVDRELSDTRPVPLVDDWCGGSFSGLATIADSAGSESSNHGHLGGNDLLPAGCSPFAGQIAILRLYDQALSSEEIEQLLTPAQPPVLNRAPRITAGSDRSVSYTEKVTLAGAVTDETLPQGSDLNLLWRQISGPGATLFSDASATNSICSCTLPGVYALRLEADDSEVKVYDEFELTVAPFSYAEWVREYDIPADEDGTEQNPDGDQLLNIWEWALGFDPLTADNATGVGNRAVAWTADGKFDFTFSFELPRNRAPLVRLQGSSDLQHWNLLPEIVPQVTILNAFTARHILTLEKDVEIEPRYFVRPTVEER